MISNYFKVLNGSGRSRPENFFPFDHENYDEQRDALQAATATSDDIKKHRPGITYVGRIVVWRHPRYEAIGQSFQVIGETQ
jgi:hypothetical protein